MVSLAPINIGALPSSILADVAADLAGNTAAMASIGAALDIVSADNYASLALAAAAAAGKILLLPTGKVIVGVQRYLDGERD